MPMMDAYLMKLLTRRHIVSPRAPNTPESIRSSSRTIMVSVSTTQGDHDARRDGEHVEAALPAAAEDVGEHRIAAEDLSWNSTARHTAMANTATMAFTTVPMRCSADFSCHCIDVPEPAAHGRFGLLHAAIGHGHVDHAGGFPIFPVLSGGFPCARPHGTGAARLERQQEEHDDLADKPADARGERDGHALGHELVGGLGDVDVVVARLHRRGVVRRAVDGEVVVEPCLHLRFRHAVFSNAAAFICSCG